MKTAVPSLYCLSHFDVSPFSGAEKAAPARGVWLPAGGGAGQAQTLQAGRRGREGQVIPKLRQHSPWVWKPSLVALFPGSEFNFKSIGDGPMATLLCGG